MVNRKNRSKFYRTRYFLLAAALTLSYGAAEVYATADEPVSASSAAEEETIEKTIGKKEEGESIVHVILENKTGGKIIQVSVIDDMTDLPIEKLLENEDVFEKDEVRILYYDKGPAEDEAARRNASAGEGAQEIVPEYLLRITTEDGTVYDLHGLSFTDMKKGEIRLEEGVAYFVYKSAESGREINTKQDELAEKERKEAAQPSYEEPIYYEEPVYEAPVYEEPVYEEPVYEEPVYEAPVIDNGGGDQCITDGLTY